MPAAVRPDEAAQRTMGGFMVRTTCGIAVFGICLLGAGQAQAAADVSEILLFKGVDRSNGVIVPVDPYFFEACLKGTGIASATVTKPGGTPQGMSLEEGEYCFDANFADQPTLDSTYPSTGGNYTFTVTPSAGPNQVYVIPFSASAPTAFPAISAPSSAVNVLADRDLTVTWSLSPVCPVPSTCADGIQIFVGDADDDVYQAALGPAATSDSVPETVLAAGTAYSLEVETYRGVLSMDDTQAGDPFEYDAIYEDLNNSGFMAVARTMDLDFAEIFKLVDRQDGVVGGGNPYGLEACVAGTGIQSASIDTPDGTKVLAAEGFGEFCFDDAFATENDLNTAYPSAGETYTYFVTQADGATANIPLVFDESSPLAFIDYTNPSQGEEIPPGQDLDVTWDLDKGQPACNAPGDCGDGILFFLIEQPADIDVDETELPITDTNRLVDASVLTATSYELEVETYNGDPGSQQTDGTTDDYTQVLLWEDINALTFTVPEPGVVALRLAALATLLGLGALRRRTVS